MSDLNCMIEAMNANALLNDLVCTVSLSIIITTPVHIL